jgi:hypothetical protein
MQNSFVTSLPWAGALSIATQRRTQTPCINFGSFVNSAPIASPEPRMSAGGRERRRVNITANVEPISGGDVATQQMARCQPLPAQLRRAHVVGFEVAGQLRQFVGREATWSKSGPGSKSSFDLWISGPAGSGAPTLQSSAVTLNGWEMILLAAYHANRIDRTRLLDLYRAAGKNLREVLAPNGLHTLDLRDPSAPRPFAGDIVVWGDALHVALSTGLTDPEGHQHVYTFGPPAANATEAETRKPIAVATIQELSAHEHLQHPRGVSFGHGPWAAKPHAEQAEVI